jgi:2-keto-4-pentenoate hydratase
MISCCEVQTSAPQLCRTVIGMTDPARIRPIVDRLVRGRQSGQPIPADALDPTLTQDEAYAVQAGVAASLGWFPHGPAAWKVGGTSVISAAPLPQVLSSPATWPGVGPQGVLIEAELAFRLARAPEGPEDILASLGTVGASIELIGTRLADGLKAPAAWKLADQGVHAGLVMGPEQPFATCASFTTEDWRQQACQIRVNGQPVQQTRGSHPSVSPLTTLSWLVDHAATHTGGLRAGDLITTGAWAIATVHAGDQVVVAFDGFGSASMSVGTLSASVLASTAS